METTLARRVQIAYRLVWWLGLVLFLALAAYLLAHQGQPITHTHGHVVNIIVGRVART